MGVRRVALLAESAVLLVLFLQGLPPAKGAVYMEYVSDPEYPGTCLNRQTGARVTDGYTWDLPGCMGAACFGFGDDMVIEYYTCGAVNVDPPCIVTHDLSQSYPHCCGKIYCPPQHPRAERSARLP